MNEFCLDLRIRLIGDLLDLILKENKSDCFDLFSYLLLVNWLSFQEFIEKIISLIAHTTQLASLNKQIISKRKVDNKINF